MIRSVDRLDDGGVEVGGEHGDGAEGEIVLSAEPFGDLAWTAAYGLGQLLARESSVEH